jgi:hypothetical protein
LWALDFVPTVSHQHGGAAPRHARLALHCDCRARGYCGCRHLAAAISAALVTATIGSTLPAAAFTASIYASAIADSAVVCVADVSTKFCPAEAQAHRAERS